LIIFCVSNASERKLFFYVEIVDVLPQIPLTLIITWLQLIKTFFTSLNYYILLVQQSSLNLFGIKRVIRLFLFDINLPFNLHFRSPQVYYTHDLIITEKRYLLIISHTHKHIPLYVSCRCYFLWMSLYFTAKHSQLCWYLLNILDSLDTFIIGNTCLSLNAPIISWLLDFKLNFNVQQNRKIKNFYIPIFRSYD
jgi:hypothetical protein